MTNSSAFAPRPRVRRTLPALLATGLVAGGLLLGTAPPSLADAAAAPTVLDGKRVNELAAPAVRLVVVDHAAEVLVYEPEIDEAAVEAWAYTPEVLAALYAGADPEALVVQALIKDPALFLVKGREPQRQQVSTQSVGSGFVVTPDGYVVTNAHVVDSTSDELKAGLVDTALEPVVQSVAQEVTASLGGSYDEATLTALTSSVAGFIAQSMEVAKVETSVQTAEGTQVPGREKEFKLAKAEVVSTGDLYPGKDVALLKVEGRDLPTIPLGDDSTVDTGETLYALGYPANVTFLDDFTESAQSTATLTNGVVSAKKQTSGGYTAIQTDATISGGNSGGPALDDTGRVVGLTTAGLVSGEGKTGGAYNFVVPVGVAKEFLQRSNVTPVESKSTALWRTALEDMDRHHYSRAAATLRQLDSLNPGRPDVQDRLREADGAVAAGNDETPGGLGTGLLIGLITGAVVALALLALLVFVLVRRRRRATVLAAPVTPYGPEPLAPQPYAGHPHPSAPQWAYGAYPPPGQRGPAPEPELTGPQH